MSRRDDIDLISALYGAPGEGPDTSDGRGLLVELLDDMGLDALTDEAVRNLAQRHQSRDSSPLR